MCAEKTLTLIPKESLCVFVDQDTNADPIPAVAATMPDSKTKGPDHQTRQNHAN